MEQQLAYIKKCLELGANIEIMFHNFKKDEEEAKKVAMELSKIIDLPVKELSSGNTSWLQTEKYLYENENSFVYDRKIETTIFYENSYLDEDVNLDGVADEAI
jgi:hypothetical protein